MDSPSSTDRERLPLEKQRWWQRAGVKPRDFFSWLILAGACFVVIWSLASSVWRNYQIREDIATANTNLTKLTLERDRLKSLLVYYNSRSFQEIELRRHFLLKRPDETVVALRSNQPLSGVATPEELSPKTIDAPPATGWRLWWQFYFGSEAPVFTVTKAD